MPDRIILEESGIEIETPLEPAGPLDLAETIVRLRGATSFPASPLSDSGVHKLLGLAFFLSIRADEGRYPRLRIVCEKPTDYRLAVKFSTPVEFADVHEIRRLAPVAGSPDFALLVTETESGDLECAGLANIGHLGHQSQPGRPEIVPVGSLPSLRIWIEGPGHLFVEEIGTVFELRAGRVRLVRPALYFIPTLREWTSNLSEFLHTLAIESVNEIPEAATYFGGTGGLSTITNTVLQRILGNCLELRHGGAFVILPESNGNSEAFGIECKYPLAKPDLGEDLANYWSTHIKACYSKNNGVDEYQGSLQRCYQSKAALLTNVDAIANMSAADGCVVLTNQLRLLGFGGSIKVSESDCRSAERKYRFSKDHPCDIDEFFRSVGGQRHQSAARLVIKHKDVIVFVVSQDAELSVFASDDEGYVRVYQPLDASFTPTR